MTAEEAIQEGYKCFCIQCTKVYKKTQVIGKSKQVAWEQR